MVLLVHLSLHYRRATPPSGPSLGKNLILRGGAPTSNYQISGRATILLRMSLPPLMRNCRFRLILPIFSPLQKRRNLLRITLFRLFSRGSRGSIIPQIHLFLPPLTILGPGIPILLKKMIFRFLVIESRIDVPVAMQLRNVVPKAVSWVVEVYAAEI